MNSRTIDANSRHALAQAGTVKLGSSLLVITMLVLGTQAAQAQAARECAGNLQEEPLPTNPNDLPPDLIVKGGCSVPIGTGKKYFFKQVNILSGGSLIFNEHTAAAGSQTHFWASSIIIENNGVLKALNAAEGSTRPFGVNGGVLTIHLYGTNDGRGALCKGHDAGEVPPFNPSVCGIPRAQVWDTNGASKVNLPGVDAQGKPVNDYFYQYGPLHGDEVCTPNPTTGKCEQGYFGNKVLAVSYGGTLDLSGYKGSNLINPRGKEEDPVNSGWSWMRLEDGKSLNKDAKELFLEGNPGGVWRNDDEIVVTTTDYLPGHSEKLTITGYQGGTKIPFKENIQWPHNGARYGGPNDPAHKKLTDRLPARLQKSLDNDLVKNGAETRAAVALLTRSIQIVSAGEKAGEDFPKEDRQYYYGAHMVIRQGFKSVQIQGVEFRQMGQGGRLGHYPVHFHMARQTPYNTYIKDSSINESMTRWIVLHATLGVTVARNVGYKSIGHGFYLETGTETDNKFYSNIGIFARAAIDNIQNPRKIPGILADNQEVRNAPAKFPFLTDSTYPSVFWITNGWNDFIGNMAAGAGACGAAYWFVPVLNSDMPEVKTASNVEDGMHMKWRDVSAYAALQNNLKGTTPLKSFYKNYATSTMMSFQTTGDVGDCHGVVKANDPATENVLKVVKSFAPELPAVYDQLKDTYYPHALGGNRHATRCPPNANGNPDCKIAKECGSGQEQDCAVTVLDHFTSAFHWAEYTIAAIWLRNQWYLVTNSVLSDVQNGGLTFVSGGDYTHASTIKGFWDLVRNSIFIGHTQNSDKFSSDAGPFSDQLECDWQKQLKKNPQAAVNKSYCLSRDEGISMQLTPNFGLGQQLFHVYDGPAHQDSNAYLDITKTACPNPGCMYNTGSLAGIPKDNGGACYLPNAAIGWKQPNGFFYPPSFHSKNLFFSNVDIRHYVVDPLFQVPQGVAGKGREKEDFGQGGTYLTATSGPNDVQSAYCTTTPDMFNDFTGIDRQTVLNDDDGSLTGLNDTISINEDDFFRAPVETAECKGNLGVSPSLACSQAKPPTPSTAKTSPYDYIVTAVAPGCSQNDPPIKGKGFGRCGDDPDDGGGGQETTATFNGANTTSQAVSIAGKPGRTAYICSLRVSGLGATAAKSVAVTVATLASSPTLTYQYNYPAGAKTIAPPLEKSFSPCLPSSTVGNSITVTVPGAAGNTQTDVVVTGYLPMGRLSWSSRCSTPGCYGVPLYRQFLTSDEQTRWDSDTFKCTANKKEPKCRWPFIRMGGFNIYQRHTLTLNGGTYYLDTSVPLETQQNEPFTKRIVRDVNVFEGGQTYYVFFLFAKPTTKQTYQIYVGDKPATIKPVRANLASGPIKFKDGDNSPPWFTVGKLEGKVLTVTVDFTKYGDELNPTNNKNGQCGPKNFCKWGTDAGSCVSNLAANDPQLLANKNLKDEVDAACRNWAAKDLDCPENGCFGFSFTLDNNFNKNPDGTPKKEPDWAARPVPSKFPDWTTQFVRTTTDPDNMSQPKKGIESECYYPKLPPKCSAPID
jgi:hypothetical protein